MINKKHIIITAVITFFVTAALIVAALGSGFVMLLPYLSGNGTQKLGRIESIVDKYYIYDYDKEEMMDMALSAYAYGVGDPYTQYINKDEFEELLTDMGGNYVGIGVEVFVDTDGLITVIAPFDDSPAAEAGILPGDKIIRVGDTEVGADNYVEAVRMIKGGADAAAGQKVSITIKRGEEIIPVEAVRDDIVIITAKERMLAEHIGYVRLSSFDEHTPEEFVACMERLEAQGAKGVVIDLRNNPGGTLDSVVKVADYLLPEGNIITIKDKQGEETKYDSDEEYNDIPLCVLINGSSASASEALSGAIADNGRGTLIGDKTFGKGVVQSVFEMGDGTAFKVTTAKYYTPGGTCIDQIGITPHIEVSLDEDMANQPVANIPYDKDYQLQRAVEELKGK